MNWKIGLSNIVRTRWRCRADLKRREKLRLRPTWNGIQLFPSFQTAPIELPCNGMTLNDAFQPFLLHGQVERRYATETLGKLQECFRSWLKPHLGSRDVDRIGYLDLLQLRKAMNDAGLSVARQYSILMVLKLLFSFCRTRLKLVCLDPAEIQLPRRVHRKVEFLTEQEIAALLRIIPTHTLTGLRIRALVEVLLSTGLRISEALSLDRESIDPDTGEAEVIGKGNKSRAVFFSPYCLNWIRRYQERRTDNFPALFTTTGVSPRRLSRNDMSKAFRRLRMRSGIKKKLTPHLLRHTFCTSLLHHGADIMFIKELAGHQDIQTTARYYLGVDKASLKNALRRSQIHGWAGDGQLASSSDEVLDGRIPGTSGGPVWPPGGPDPGSSGRLYPGAHAPGSP
jgi:integrase/recombinase XerD